MNYRVVGTGDGKRPLVVTIHGLMGSMSTFSEMAEDLHACGYDVLLYDLFGFGLSDSPKGPFNVRLFADQALELLRHIGVPGMCPLFIFGFSMGGTVAMELALRLPDRVRRVLLIAPAGLVPLTTLERSGIRVLQAARALRVPAATWFGRMLRDGQVDPEKFEPDMSDEQSDKAWEIAERNAEMFGSNREKYAKAWLKSVRDMGLGSSRGLYARMAASPTEVMFLWGDSDGVVPLRQVQKELRVFFPTAPVMIVKGAGHALLAEQPEAASHYAACWFSHGTPGINALRQKAAVNSDDGSGSL